MRQHELSPKDMYTIQENYALLIRHFFVNIYFIYWEKKKKLSSQCIYLRPCSFPHTFYLMQCTMTNLDDKDGFVFFFEKYLHSRFLSIHRIFTMKNQYTLFVLFAIVLLGKILLQIFLVLSQMLHFIKLLWLFNFFT